MTEMRLAWTAAGIVAILSTTAAASSGIVVKNEGDAVEITLAEPLAERPPEPPANIVIPATWTVGDLVQSFASAFRQEDKDALLQRLGETKPTSLQDLRRLLDLYTRNYAVARAQAELSLARLEPRDRAFAPFFLSLLQDEDHFLRVFGVMGLERLRHAEAAEPLRAIASRKFLHPRTTLNMAPAEANDWNLGFRALRALAALDDPKAPALLEARVKEAPLAAALLAHFYWEKSLDRIVRWSESKDAGDLERARHAWAAEVPVEKLRATRERLFALVGDRRRQKGTRHQAALKLGFAAEEGDISRILAEREKASDELGRTLWAASLFASRNPRAVPLLTEYAKTHADPASRAGALYQLGEMLPKEGYRELLRWVSEHDEDEENRRIALTRLSEAD